MNDSIDWRHQILDKLFYQLSGYDILGQFIEKNYDISNELLDDIIAHFDRKIEIANWTEHVKDMLEIYFDENKIKDKEGKIIKF